MEPIEISFLLSIGSLAIVAIFAILTIIADTIEWLTRPKQNRRIR